MVKHITFFQFQQDADNTKLYAIVKKTMMYYNFNLSLTSNNTVKWSNNVTILRW